MFDATVHGSALVQWHIPFLSGGAAQEFPCCRSYLPEWLMPGSNRNAAPSHLNIQLGIGPLPESWVLEVRMVEGFDVVDLGHIHFQFLSQQHGQRGVDALSHLGTWYSKVDTPIRGDAQVGRQGRAGACLSEFGQPGEAEYQSAAYKGIGFKEFASVEFNDVYASSLSCAARWMAWRTWL